MAAARLSVVQPAPSPVTLRLHALAAAAREVRAGSGSTATDTEPHVQRVAATGSGECKLWRLLSYVPIALPSHCTHLQQVIDVPGHPLSMPTLPTPRPG